MTQPDPNSEAAAANSEITDSEDYKDLAFLKRLLTLGTVISYLAALLCLISLPAACSIENDMAVVAACLILMAACLINALWLIVCRFMLGWFCKMKTNSDKTVEILDQISNQLKKQSAS